MLNKTRSDTPFWTGLWRVLRSVDLFAISSAILDGTNYSEYVRNYTWYVSGAFLTDLIHLQIVNYATYLMVDRSPNSKKPSQASLNMAIALLTCTAVIFRAEVALLLIPLCLQLLFSKRLAFRHVIRVGLVSGLLSIGIQYCPHPHCCFLTLIFSKV